MTRYKLTFVDGAKTFDIPLQKGFTLEQARDRLEELTALLFDCAETSDSPVLGIHLMEHPDDWKPIDYRSI